LRTNGLFFLSTPNRKYTEPYYKNGKSANPYHVREFYPEEVAELLQEFFEIKGIYYESRVDASDDPMNQKRTNYARACMIPQPIRKFFPVFLKNTWLRAKHIPTIKNVRGKWQDFSGSSG
jgi:hypothetical protein